MIRQNLIKYIQQTPLNFNPNIFNGMVDSYVANINQFYRTSNCTKLEDYLYSIEYNTIDYDAGAEYTTRYLPRRFGCSSVCVNGIYGRNYDWLYDNTVSFVVHTTPTLTRHESYGIATVANLTKSLVESGDWSDLYAILPSLTLDGINDAHVACNTNVVPTGDYGLTSGTNPQYPDLCALSVCRFILDNANSVDDALAQLSKRNIWMPNSQAFKQELHFMIADPIRCVVVEFINNKMVVLDADSMTNFYLYNVLLNSDGSVYTPATQTDTDNAIVTNHITPFGCGLERYNLINSRKDSITNIEDMSDLIYDLHYSNTYVNEQNDNCWYTELVGIKGLTVVSTPEQYAPSMEIARADYIHRDRNKPQIWHTVHSSIYDLNSLTMTVYSQEGDTAHTFNFE